MDDMVKILKSLDRGLVWGRYSQRTGRKSAESAQVLPEDDRWYDSVPQSLALLYSKSFLFKTIVQLILQSIFYYSSFFFLL